MRNAMSSRLRTRSDIQRKSPRRFASRSAKGWSARPYASTLETLAEVAREFGSILNLDELLTRLASVTRRVIDYRTFGILLLNEETNELEMKTAVRYGDQKVPTHVKVGDGLVGYA